MERYAQSVEARAVDVRPNNSEVPQEQLPGQLEEKSTDYSQGKKKSLRARFKYGIIFLIINLKAWFFRDYGQKFLAQFSCESMFLHFYTMPQRMDCTHLKFFGS